MASNKPEDKGLRNTVIGTVLFIVVALVGVSLYTNSAKNATFPGGTSKSDGYGITFNSEATPQIDIWEDFQCPICKTFEGINNSYVNDLATSGKAKVVYHPMAFIGAESVTAANAAACSNEEGKFILFCVKLVFFDALKSYASSCTVGCATDSYRLEHGEDPACNEGKKLTQF